MRCETRHGASARSHGILARISTTHTTGTALFNLPAPTIPSQHYTAVGSASIVSLTPDRYAFSWIVRSTGTFDALSAGPGIAPGDSVDLDGIWWPI